MDILALAFVLACMVGPLIGIVTAVLYHVGAALWRRGLEVTITIGGDE